MPVEQAAAGQRRSRGLSDIAPQYVAKSGLCGASSDVESSRGSIRIRHLTGSPGSVNQDEREARFPRLDNCCHYHYDNVDLPSLQLTLCKEDAKCLGYTEEKALTIPVSVRSHGSTWVVRRTLENLRLLDEQLHRCIFDRKVSKLPLVPEAGEYDEVELRQLFDGYLAVFAPLIGNHVNCGPVLNWLELDNRGRRLLVPDTDNCPINTPAVAAAYSVTRYVAQAGDELSFEVGDMISVIDMPPPEESVWWRGKRGFQVGFFPGSCVAVIGDKLPRSLVLPQPSIASTSSAGSAGSEPSKPVLRKHGKLIAFFRSFILARPSRRRLKQSGILKERVFGCDLGEHLLNSGHQVPMVLKCCTEFIEANGIVDGIYRLSGITSNIQKLRNAFDEDRIPALYEDQTIIQDIHSVASLLKMYFRELPNPLCTYQLYHAFVGAVGAVPEQRLLKMREAVSKLPPPHYRTLQYLMTHLARVAERGHMTGMTPRNVAIVWAPNLLRCKELEVGGVAALQGVGIQAVVTEFLICYADLIFCDNPPSITTLPQLEASPQRSRPKSLAIATPTKLLSLEEARIRALSTSGKTDNSADYIEVGGGPGSLPARYHTVLDLPRKRGGSRKRSPIGWKSLFTKAGRKNSMRKLQMMPIPNNVGPTKKLVIKETDTCPPIRRNLRPVKSAESLDAVNRSNRNSTAIEPELSQETLSQSLASLGKPNGHNRSISHDSYFDILGTPLLSRPTTRPSRLVEADNEDSSLDLSEIQLNFDLEESEMRMFSEDEAQTSTSSPRFCPKAQLSLSGKRLPLRDAPPPRAHPEDSLSQCPSLDPSPKKQKTCRGTPPPPDHDLTSLSPSESTRSKRSRLEEQLASSAGELRFIDSQSPDNTVIVHAEVHPLSTYSFSDTESYDQLSATPATPLQPYSALLSTSTSPSPTVTPCTETNALKLSPSASCSLSLDLFPHFPADSAKMSQSSSLEIPYDRMSASNLTPNSSGNCTPTLMDNANKVASVCLVGNNVYHLGNGSFVRRRSGSGEGYDEWSRRDEEELAGGGSAFKNQRESSSVSSIADTGYLMKLHYEESSSEPCTVRYVSVPEVGDSSQNGGKVVDAKGDEVTSGNHSDEETGVQRGTPSDVSDSLASDVEVSSPPEATAVREKILVVGDARLIDELWPDETELSPEWRSCSVSDRRPRLVDVYLDKDRVSDNVYLTRDEEKATPKGTLSRQLEKLQEKLATGAAADETLYENVGGVRSPVSLVTIKYENVKVGRTMNEAKKGDMGLYQNLVGMGPHVEKDNDGVYQNVPGGTEAASEDEEHVYEDVTLVSPSSPTSQPDVPPEEVYQQVKYLRRSVHEINQLLDETEPESERCVVPDEMSSDSNNTCDSVESPQVEASFTEAVLQELKGRECVVGDLIKFDLSPVDGAKGSGFEGLGELEKVDCAKGDEGRSDSLAEMTGFGGYGDLERKADFEDGFRQSGHGDMLVGKVLDDVLGCGSFFDEVAKDGESDFSSAVRDVSSAVVDGSVPESAVEGSADENLEPVSDDIESGMNAAFAEKNEGVKLLVTEEHSKTVSDVKASPKIDSLDDFLNSGFASDPNKRKFESEIGRDILRERKMRQELEEIRSAKKPVCIRDLRSKFETSPTKDVDVNKDFAAENNTFEVTPKLSRRYGDAGSLPPCLRARAAKTARKLASTTSLSVSLDEDQFQAANENQIARTLTSPDIVKDGADDDKIRQDSGGVLKVLNADFDDSERRARIEKYKEERRLFLREKYRAESFKGESDLQVERLKQKVVKTLSSPDEPMETVHSFKDAAKTTCAEKTVEAPVSKAKPDLLVKTEAQKRSPERVKKVSSPEKGRLKFPDSRKLEEAILDCERRFSANDGSLPRKKSAVRKAGPAEGPITCVTVKEHSGADRMNVTMGLRGPKSKDSDTQKSTKEGRFKDVDARSSRDGKIKAAGRDSVSPSSYRLPADSLRSRLGSNPEPTSPKRVNDLPKRPTSIEASGSVDKAWRNRCDAFSPPSWKANDKTSTGKNVKKPESPVELRPPAKVGSASWKSEVRRPNSIDTGRKELPEPDGSRRKSSGSPSYCIRDMAALFENRESVPGRERTQQCTGKQYMSSV